MATTAASGKRRMTQSEVINHFAEKTGMKRNPATGATIQIPAKTTLKFRVGKSMKDTVLPKK
jgi:nucleoid DNA-binding protein